MSSNNYIHLHLFRGCSAQKVTFTDDAEVAAAILIETWFG